MTKPYIHPDVSDNNEASPANPLVYEPDPLVSELILSMYSPTEDYGVIPEFISPIDLWEMINQNFHINKEHLYNVMHKSGFRCMPIDDELFWKVFPR